jgi:hypothetical protein
VLRRCRRSAARYSLGLCILSRAALAWQLPAWSVPSAVARGGEHRGVRGRSVPRASACAPWLPLSASRVGWPGCGRGLAVPAGRLLEVSCLPKLAGSSTRPARLPVRGRSLLWGPLPSAPLRGGLPGNGQTCHIQRPYWSVVCGGGSSPRPWMRVGARTRRSSRRVHRPLRAPRRGLLAAGAVCVRWRFGLPLVPCRSTAPRAWLARRGVRSVEVGLVPPSPSGARGRRLVWGLAFCSRGSVLPGGASSPRPAGSSVGSSSSSPLHRGVADSSTAGSSLRMRGVTLRPGHAQATSRRCGLGTGLGVVSPDAGCAARL